MVIEAGVELTLKAGGSFIKLDRAASPSPARWRESTPAARRKGSGIKIKSPVLPGMSDRDKAGRLLEQAPASPLKPKHKVKRMMNFSG